MIIPIIEFLHQSYQTFIIIWKLKENKSKTKFDHTYDKISLLLEIQQDYMKHESENEAKWIVDEKRKKEWIGKNKMKHYIELEIENWKLKTKNITLKT